MIRKIIKIDEHLCNGCGTCIDACHEHAIELINNKATLIRDDYCDGLGNCLPVCPTNAITFEEREALDYNDEEVQKTIASKQLTHLKTPRITTQLNQWPVQIQLVSPKAPFLNDCDLLIAADCTAYAYGNFHNDFLKNRIVLIGCPKLDTCDYSEKLTEILSYNQINSVTIIRMSVPCCSGIAHASMKAIHNSGKSIPYNIIIISPDGTILK